VTQTIGYIGLGVLGSAMVPNIIKDGFKVIGYDVRGEAMVKLAALGMEASASPMDVASRSDVVITCLPSIDAMLAVYGGDEGIDKANKPGQIVIETSTFPIDVKEKCHALMKACGKRMLDCPVSGNRMLAEKKQLTAFASGEEADFQEVEDVINGFALRVFYVGAFGSGMKMKFCANILNLVHNAAAAEVMVLGMKSGLDPAMMHQVIGGSGSSSSMFETRGALMVKDDYDYEGSNFSTPIKDSRFISQHAHDLRVPTPIYHVALQSYYAAVAQGHLDEDAAAVVKAMERAANYDRPSKDGND
jgi:putative dehydrogenase